MSLTVRAATPDDIPALHALIEGAYRGDSARRGWTHEADLLGGQRTDVEALAEIVGDLAKVLLTAWDGGTLVGCVLAAEEVPFFSHAVGEVAQDAQSAARVDEGSLSINSPIVTRRFASHDTSPEDGGRMNVVGYLGMLSVDPARQAGGIGRRLVEAAEAWAAARGCDRMRMTVIRQRDELIAWYERLGYVRVGTEPFPATNPRFGLPKRDDLGFVVLTKGLG